MNQDSELFQTLVLQLVQGTWVSLGKIPNPMTGKIERNLDVARMTIDTLAAIESRTKGNLDDDEKALVDRSLRELRMNYLDESKKQESDMLAGEAGEDKAETGNKETVAEAGNSDTENSEDKPDTSPTA